MSGLQGGTTGTQQDSHVSEAVAGNFEFLHSSSPQLTYYSDQPQNPQPISIYPSTQPQPNFYEGSSTSQQSSFYRDSNSTANWNRGLLPQQQCSGQPQYYASESQYLSNTGYNQQHLLHPVGQHHEHNSFVNHSMPTSQQQRIGSPSATQYPSSSVTPPNTFSQGSAITQRCISPLANQMMPVRLQNMTKGARTKAGMRKLMQMQSQNPSQPAPIIPITSPKKMKTRKSSNVDARHNATQLTSVSLHPSSSVGEAFEATISSPNSETVGQDSRIASFQLLKVDSSPPRRPGRGRPKKLVESISSPVDADPSSSPFKIGISFLRKLSADVDVSLKSPVTQSDTEAIGSGNGTAIRTRQRNYPEKSPTFPKRKLDLEIPLSGTKRRKSVASSAVVSLAEERRRKSFHGISNDETVVSTIGASIAAAAAAVLTSSSPTIIKSENISKLANQLAQKKIKKTSGLNLSSLVSREELTITMVPSEPLQNTKYLRSPTQISPTSPKRRYTKKQGKSDICDLSLPKDPSIPLTKRKYVRRSLEPVSDGKGNRKISSSGDKTDNQETWIMGLLAKREKDKTMKRPSVIAKPSQHSHPVVIDSKKEKGPSLKVEHGAVKFYKGEDEQDVDESFKKLEAVLKESLRKDYNTDNDNPWICVFCGLGPHDMRLGDLFGPYFVKGQREELQQTKNSKLPTEREVWVHTDCALWAGDVILVGASLRNLDETVLEAEKVMCRICQNYGATIGCLKRGCEETAHFPCAKLNDWNLNGDTFHSHCRDHVGEAQA